MASVKISARTRRKSPAPSKADPEFDAEGTLTRLAELLTKSTSEKQTADDVAYIHMGAHGHASPTDADKQCKRRPCKLAGTSFAYAEIQAWLDWTRNERPPLKLDQGARDLVKTVLTHPVVSQLKVYMRNNRVRFHPSKDEHKHLTVAECAATCEAPAIVLHSVVTLVRSVESFLTTLHVPPMIVNSNRRAPGRPKQLLFHSVAQHLFAGGHSYGYVAKLLGCSVERARGAIRSKDARWFVSEGGTRPLPTS